MTQRLYYTDSYLKDFDAFVVERADDGRRIYLDRTAFYPTSGGQSFDTGRLGGIEVTDVVDEGERIAHVLGGAVDLVGIVAERLQVDRIDPQTHPLDPFDDLLLVVDCDGDINQSFVVDSDNPGVDTHFRLATAESGY